MRRLLAEGDPAGVQLFARWYATGTVALERLRRNGVIRPVGEADVVAAFLMVNDLALLMLREQLWAVLGLDPLSREGLSERPGTEPPGADGEGAPT